MSRGMYENNFLALILYGSWVKEKARGDSDKVASSFKRLFSFFVKMEYQFQLPDKDEATLAIEDANRIIKVARGMMKKSS